ncbi:hypothetical protein [Citrifermentans bremense]|nr:hypothetical protein [Citrifermentans bremense]
MESSRGCAEVAASLIPQLLAKRPSGSIIVGVESYHFVKATLMPLDNLQHPEMINKATAVARALTPELYAYLVSLLPTPEELTELCRRYRESFAASLNGDPEQANICEEDRVAVSQVLTLLSGFGKAAAVKDPGVLGKLALHHLVSKKSAAATAVGSPGSLRIAFEPSGKPYAALAKVSGAKGYEIWCCGGDPGVESNWSLLAWSTNCKKIYLPGLDRNANFLRVRGKRGNKVGPWSNIVKIENL